MTRSWRRIILVLIAALVLLGVFANCAFAALEDPPVPTLGVSKTNPDWGKDAWWRQGWGNTAYPEFELNPPGVWDEANDGYLVGDIYRVDRAPITLIATRTPNLYDRCSYPVDASGRPRGTNLDNTLDMLAIWMPSPLNGSWPPTNPVDIMPLEGQWYMHYVFYSNTRYANLQYNMRFGIDFTPPNPVTGVKVSTNINTTQTPYPANQWMPTRRGYISWDAGQQDPTSGVGYYQVLVDDELLAPETTNTPVQGRAYASPTPLAIMPDSYTIESLPAGRHKLTVVAVDRATNMGLQGGTSSVYYQSDPDTPTISWISPIGGALVPQMKLISVNASDLAGNPVVTLAMDGTQIATMTAPPYAVSPDLSAVPNGTHTLTATVTDHFGRKVTLSKTVTWNDTGIAGQSADASLDVTQTAYDSVDAAGADGEHWTNNLMPVVDLLPPDAATDVFYNVVQTPVAIDRNNLQNYFHATRPTGTYMSNLANLKDTIDTRPFGPWAPGPLGSVAPYEGSWYFQLVWYNRDMQLVSSKTYTVPFKVDLTPPTQVQSFSATPVAGTWTSSRRVHLTWNSSLQYDALSGTQRYKIYLDNADSGMSVEATSVMAGSITIEDVPSGEHKIAIAAVDRAGNVGPKSELTLRSDPDVPTLGWLEPTDAAMSPLNNTIVVDALDLAGDPVVTFAVDGTRVATLTAPPYTSTPDLFWLSNGAHTLTATATDHFGHTITITKPITWNYSGASLAWVAPVGASLTPTNTLVSVTASDVAGNPVVYFAIDGARVATITAPPYSKTLDMFRLTNGAHVLTASATNHGKTTTIAKPFTWTYGGPAIAWSSPINTLMAPGVTAMSVDATDMAGDPLVTFSIKGSSLATTALGTVALPPYTLKPTLAGLPDGAYTLIASASNSYGRSVTTTRAITWNSAVVLLPDAGVDLDPTQHIGTSRTNPGAADDVDAWWRQGWGNSLYPQFSLNPPSTVPSETGLVSGMLYDLTPATSDINLMQPANYYRAARGTGTNLDETIDLMGIFNYSPVGGWRASMVPGATSLVEGPWYMNLVWFTSKGFASDRTYHIPTGIDITPPAAVESLSVSPSKNPADGTGILATSRLNVAWRPKAYDALSGVAYYQVKIDDSMVLPDSPSNPVQGRVYEVPGVMSGSVAIEQAPPGRHKITVQAVDRATNVGPEVSVFYTSDPDTPTVSWTSPRGTSLVPQAHVISVNASDLAGDPRVTFQIDGLGLGTLTAPPYSINPDLSGLAAGPHTLRATVVDTYGRTVTITKAVTWGTGGFAVPTPDASLDVIGSPGSSPDSAGTDGTHWTNNLTPFASLNPTEGASDIFYNIVQTPANITPATMGGAYHAVRPDGTHFDQLVNLKDSINAGSWLPGPTGSVAPYEGSWYFQWVWYDTVTQGVSTKTYRLRYNIDLTPPTAVTGFTVTPVGGTWTAASRAHLTWTAAEYDALSGDDYYQVFIDGVATMQIDSKGAMSNSVTIEDMPAGSHKIAIAAVDRAGNIGAKSEVVFKSDPDVPGIAWREPVGDTLTSLSRVVSVDASDKAGSPLVSFYMDGSLLGTVGASPYRIVADLGAFTEGVHTLSASARDPLGRLTTISRQITWTPNGFIVDPGDPGTPTGAGLDTTVTADSVSNPDMVFARQQIDSDRNGWGNSLNPDFSIPLVSPAEGFLYNVVTVPAAIDHMAPQNYYRAANPGGTSLIRTLDMQGIFNYPPVGGWRNAPIVGAQSPIEGWWYLQWKPYDRQGHIANITQRRGFGIDVTPPSSVTGLHAVPTVGGVAGTVSASSRAHVTWDSGAFDTLSGVSYYKVLVDGAEVMPADGIVWDLASSVPNMVTLENLPAGKHVIGVKAVDRATNEGKVVSTDFYSDPDTPTLSFTSPSGSVIGVKAKIAVNAADVGGIKDVKFKFDGFDIGTDSAAPYSLDGDLSAFAGGTHTISATVTDMYGRQVTVTKPVNLDRTPLVLSGFSRNATLFYPIKRDGYKDNSTVYVTVNKSASVRLNVTNAAGTVLRTYVKSVGAGRTSFVWDGKWASDGKAHTGTFYYQVVASDTAGNWANTGRLSIAIRNYEVVKVAKNKVKIVAR